MQEELIQKKIAVLRNEFQPGRHTILFIHGLAGSSSAWVACAEKFCGQFNVVLMDLRGHGHSHRYARYSDYALCNFTEDIELLFKALKISQATLVAHSFGCLMALDFIIKQPEKVANVVFVSPRFNTRQSGLRVVLTLGSSLLHLVALLYRKAASPQRLDYKRFPVCTDLNPSRLYADIVNTGLSTYLHCLSQALGFRCDKQLQKITCPVLLIHGDSDSIFPVQGSVKAQREFPDARLFVVPHANHVLLFTHVDRLHRAVENFISSPPGAAEPVALPDLPTPESRRTRAMHAITFMGTPPFYFLLSLPLVFQGSRLLATYYFAVVVAELACAIVKLLTRTDRPIPRKRVTLYDQYDASTFPSAHTARIAASAGVICLYVGHMWLAIAGAAMVALVAWSRVALKHHFLKDVVAGALLGVCISAGVYQWVFAP